MATVGLKSAIALIVIPLLGATALLGWGSTDELSIEERDGLLILTEKTFDVAMKKYKSILVNFFPTNSVCKTCHHVNGEFSAAAKIFEEQNERDIRLAMVDIAADDSLRERFKIVNYPTIRYFRRGEEDDLSTGQYIGEWHSHSIVAWLRKKNGQSAYRKLHTQADIQEFAEDNDAAVVGIFRDPAGKEAKAFLTASRQVLDDGVNFGMVIPDEDIWKLEFTDKDKVAKIYIMKKFDELLVVYADKPYDSVDDIVTFVRMRAFPYVIDFTPSAQDIQRSFGNIEIHTSAVLFAPKSGDDFQKLYNEFRSAAKAIRSEIGNKILFSYVDSAHHENADWVQFFEVEDDELPLVMIVVLDGRKLRYKLKRPVLNDGVTQAPIDAKSIEKLVHDYFDDKLDPDASSYRDEL